MTTDSTLRFTDRATYYADGRAGYPDSVIEALNLPQGAVVVDVGSGTGLSADLFLRHGYEVHAVEPNSAMRQCAVERLSRYPGFHSVDGRAERTTLPCSTADLIVCASAFHWFDAEAAREEFRRVLRPQGAVAILRNGANRDGSAFMRACAELTRRYAARLAAHENYDARLRDFFAGNAYRTVQLEFTKRIDFGILTAGILSHSTMPLPGQPGHDDMMHELRGLFDQAAEDGRVCYMGKVTLHVGCLA